MNRIRLKFLRKEKEKKEIKKAAGKLNLRSD